MNKKKSIHKYTMHVGESNVSCNQFYEELVINAKIELCCTNHRKNLNLGADHNHMCLTDLLA
jgi:hypothetical protein